MSGYDFDNIYSYHEPVSKAQIMTHQIIRRELRELAELIAELCPESREKSFAMTRLEEAMMWANAAVARSPNS